jgi:hypothetical protein
MKQTYRLVPIGGNRRLVLDLTLVVRLQWCAYGRLTSRSTPLYTYSLPRS